MPISKVPIVHKFGIISHSQRLELQERLLKQTYLQSVQSQKVQVQNRNPLEVSDEFIQQFNNTKNLAEKDKYDKTARKMLERSKRRCGLKDKGSGSHVNLPMAWTELAQLAQCQGKIQEECLDVLIVSLDQSPLQKYHIPALFFLAETMLYWLRTDSVHQPYLRTGEIKLLRMGQLTFTRLFYHHMAGQLQGQNEFKNRLFTYLDGLGDCQEAYNPYPNALLCLRFIITVGKIIMADSVVEPGDVKEGDTVSKPRTPLSRPSIAYSREVSMTESRSEPGGRHSYSGHSGAISSSVHDLSPTLWHALDVWRCTNHLGGGLGEALRALSHCGMGMSSENWVDSMIAIQILAEAAKTNYAAMRVLHSLAKGNKPRIRGDTPGNETETDFSDVYSVTSEESHKEESHLSSKPTLSDIYERSDEDRESRLTFKHSPVKSSTDRAKLSRENLEMHDSNLKPALKEPSSAPGPVREVSFADTKMKQAELRSEEDIIESAEELSGHQLLHDFTGFRAEAGTEKSARDSETSSVPTYTNLPMTDTPGICSWHWEVAITYTNMLADLCLNGANANIQKVALLGSNKDVSNNVNAYSVPLKSAGLLDLAFFQVPHETCDGGPNDWSWRIRYGAIQSLVRIVRCLGDDKSKDGMKAGAWNILLRAHSKERDDRVLEALKVGQVHTDLEQLIEKPGNVTVHPVTIGAKIAEGLSGIYLPPLPPPVDPAVLLPKARKTPRNADIKSKILNTPRDDRPRRTALKEEIMLATALYEPPVSFNTRTSFDLRRIVEDQWRKELQKQMEEEENERQKEIVDMQAQQEENERQKEIIDMQAQQEEQNRDLADTKKEKFKKIDNNDVMSGVCNNDK